MGKDISHMPAASLGQYASLSFVVIGRKRNWGFRDCGFWILDSGCLYGDHFLAGRDACPTGFFILAFILRPIP